MLSFDEKLANHDVVLLQEHLLQSCRVNFLRQNFQLAVFTKDARRTRGRPSGGLGCRLAICLLATNNPLNTKLQSGLQT